MGISTKVKNCLSKSLGLILPGTLLLSGLIYLIVFARYIDGILNPILLTIIFLLTCISLQKTRTGLEIPGMVFILVLVVTSILSIDPRRSYYEAWLIGVGLVIILYSAHLVKSGISLMMISNFLLLIGLGFMVFSWSETGRWYSTWWTNSGGIFLPGISYRLGGGNVIAAYYHGILMIASARLLIARTWLQRLALVIYCFSAGALIFLSSSRGAYLSVAGGYLLLGFLYRKPILAILKKGIRLAVRYWFISVVIVLIIITLATITGSWYLKNMSSHPTHGPAMQSRNEFWTPAIKAFLSSPFWGNGPYTFASFYMQSVSVPPREIFLHAHSTYFDILSGSGLAGLAAAAWFIWVLLKKIWKVYGSNESASRNAATGALMAIGAFSIHSVFDGLYLMPLCSFNLCVFAGAILGTLPENLNRINYERIGIVFTVAVGGWFFFWLTQPYRLGVEVTQQGDLKAAEQYFSLASERDKTLSLSWQQLGLVKSVLANNGDEAALVAAIHAFEEAIRLDPAYSANYANLAALYQQKGDLEEAIHQWYQAVKLAPQSALFAINLGQNLEMVGRDSEARQQYVHVLDLEPGWANDGFWNRTDLRMDFLLNWKNMNSSAENPLITEEDALKQSLAGPFLVLAQQKILENDLSSASRMLNLGQLAYIGYRVQRLEITWLRAEIAAGQEKWIEAADLGELALDGFRQQGVDGPGSAGLSLYSYGLYRLSSLPMELVPQMTTIHLPDQWQDRMVRLGEWHSEADNQQGCLDIMNELMQYNPDFLFQLGEEKLPCEPAR